VCPGGAIRRIPPGTWGKRAWTLWTCWLAVTCPTSVAAQELPVAPQALAFFATLPPGDVAAALGSRRPPPISLDERNSEISKLPHDGLLRPVADEPVKLATLTPILRFHERAAIVEVRIIDIVQAFVGLHARSVLLISRSALQLVSPAELQALVAHEMGHEYFWDEYHRARDRHDTRIMRDVELKCDGIAALTLVELGLDPRVLPSAERKLTRFNHKLGATADSTWYPSLSERERFVLAVLAWRAQDRSHP
jgi:hypothetical protein